MTLMLLLRCGLLFEPVFGGRFLLFSSFSLCSMKGLLLFCVIILLATGWSYLKSYLTDRDKSLLVACVTVQCLVNVAMVVVGEMPEGEAHW